MNYDYPKTEMTISGKKIYKSVIKLQEDDMFIAMSDGCPHAGIGVAYNFGWKREDIISFMESIAPAGYTAKTLSTILVDECNKLYGGQPGDDATACVVRIRKRVPMNLLFGPPSKPRRQRPHDVPVLLQGGQAHHLRRHHLFDRREVPGQAPGAQPASYDQSDVPPIAYIEGVDLVTEGVITINKVLDLRQGLPRTRTTCTSSGRSSGTAHP